MHSRLARWILRAVQVIALGLSGSGVALAGSSPQVVISNVPMTLAQPTPPQVMLALTNSQSMDGSLSGAIMTGSGAVSGFSGPSSPTCYTVPAGFTPPESGAGGCPAGEAPYTVTDSGTQYDNSPSRLNVAKQALMAVIKQYAPTFNIGLMDYQTGKPSLSSTWVYYMSPTDGFAFTDDNSDPLPAGANAWVVNPCYQASSTSEASSDCASMAAVQGMSGISSDHYMAVQATSDASDINDVLYADSLPDIFMVYGGPSPSSPYPPNFSLSDYNSGNIQLYYSYTTYSNFGFSSSPTNAGYVPYSPESIDALRGFGYSASDTADSGNVLVTIKPAGVNGQPATISQINHYINKFSPYLAPETDNSQGKDIKASAGQSPIAGILAGAYSYFTKSSDSSTPTVNDCPVKRYVVLVTDGLPTEDLSGDSWPPLGSVSGNGYGVKATFNLVGGGTVSTTSSDFKADVLAGKTLGLATTNDTALSDAISKLKTLGEKNIETYVVGMGAGVDPSKNPAAAATLKALAIAGGTKNYFAGTSAQAVVQDMQVIFSQIQAANMSTTAVAANSGSIQSNTLLYQARFSSQTSPDADWTGNLFAFPLNSDLSVNTDSSDAVWQGAAQLDNALADGGWKTMPIITWNSAKNAGAPFVWSSLDAAQQTDLEQYWGSLSTTQQSAFTDEAAYGQAVLDYLRGDESQEQVNGGVFRDRSKLLGDIVDSNPLYVGPPPAVSGLSAPPASSSATVAAYTAANTAYATFAADNAGRAPIVYVGANDGQLHGFDATSGAPVFGFVPAGVYGDLADLSEPTYNANHRFYVDGSPNAGDVPFTSSGKVNWHTLLVGGLDAGGKGIYALDVTHPEQTIQNASGDAQTALAQHVLWDITDSTPGFAQLGLSYSQPQVAVMNIDNATGTPMPTPVVIFGNGYNSAASSPYLYVVNAQTGALIHSFDLCSQSSGLEPAACKSSLANGLSTPTVVSVQGNGLADRAYAGDLQGNLWRFDLSSPDPANWTARVLFKAVGPNNNPQPITTAPAVSQAPEGTNGQLVFFGTGQLLGQPDLTDTDTQSFYGVLDNGTDSALTTSVGSPQWLTRSQLRAQTIATTTYSYTDSSGDTQTENVRTIATHPVNFALVDGWYMDLPDPGERVITPPRVFGQEVAFTTDVPATSSCGGGMQSFLMVVNFATGGAFNTPVLDLNNDGHYDAGDQASGGVNPVGVDLGGVYSSGVTLMPTGKHSVKYISQSSGKIKAMRERAGLVSGRLNWDELR
ncbi:MAG: PilC/PilY family type IV pilus protein [Acidihalobacter sp.]|uniref:pilus assembly protein n=1 Tax=Acidihalobacter sp. TaxID=1872108 RepID=UPI00307DCAB7